MKKICSFMVFSCLLGFVAFQTQVAQAQVLNSMDSVHGPFSEIVVTPLAKGVEEKMRKQGFLKISINLIQGTDAKKSPPVHVFVKKGTSPTVIMCHAFKQSQSLPAGAKRAGTLNQGIPGEPLTLVYSTGPGTAIKEIAVGLGEINAKPDGNGWYEIRRGINGVKGKQTTSLWFRR